MGGIINRPKWGWESGVKMKNFSSELLKENVSVINEINETDDLKMFVSNKDKLVCFYVNARSIVYKMSELEWYVYEEKPNIIEITDSWTFEDLQNSELNIDGYILLRKGRIVGDKVRGGGVMLYIKNMLYILECYMTVENI